MRWPTEANHPQHAGTSDGDKEILFCLIKVMLPLFYF